MGIATLILSYVIAHFSCSASLDICHKITSVFPAKYYADYHTKMKCLACWVKISADDILKRCFLFCPENRL